MLLKFRPAAPLPASAVRLDLSFTASGDDNSATLLVHVGDSNWQAGTAAGGATSCARNAQGDPWGGPNGFATAGIDYTNGSVYQYEVFGNLEGLNTLPLRTADVLALAADKGWNDADLTLVITSESAGGRTMYTRESGAKAPTLVAHTCPAPNP